MRILRCKTNWMLASLFLVIITNGCTGRSGGCGRVLSPAMQAKYEADLDAHKEKNRSLLEETTQAYGQWLTLIKNNAPQDEIDLAHSEYLSATENWDNHREQWPSRWDVKYLDHHHPETGHKHGHRPVKTIPPVTTHPPKPPKPPCKGHHH